MKVEHACIDCAGCREAIAELDLPTWHAGYGPERPVRDWQIRIGTVLNHFRKLCNHPNLWVSLFYFELPFA
jgi:hypothetical protein